MTDLTIIGPGAIGLAVGAALMQGGHQVTFAARQTFASLHMTKRGGDTQSFVPRIICDPKAMAPTSWVLVCVKAHQVTGAAPWLCHVAPGTKVAVLQNGVEQRQTVAPYLPPQSDVVPAEVVPVIVDLPAARTAPGAVVWHSRAIVGTPDDDAGRAFCGLFAGSFVTAQSDPDFTTRAWKKLCVNAPGAILALSGQTMGVFHKPGVADLARAILAECVAVGRAEGAKLDDDLIETQMAAFLAEAPENGNSIYADRMAGRAMEWNARNGVIVRKGREHAIPTPVNAALVPLLSALDP